MQAYAPQQESSTGHAPGFRQDAVSYRGERGVQLRATATGTIVRLHQPLDDEGAA